MQNSSLRSSLRFGTVLPRPVSLLVSGIALIAIGSLAAQPALAMQAEGQSAIKMTVNSLGTAPANDRPEVAANDFTLTSSPSTLTIPYGSTGAETLTLAPVGIYLGIVNLTASVPVAVNTNAQGCLSGTGVVGSSISVTKSTPVTLTIYTYPTFCPITLGSLDKSPGTGNQSPANHSVPLRASLAVAGLFLAGLMGRRARKLRGAASLVLLITLGLAISGCGGGGGSTSNNLARGSYPITITGTDSLNAALTHSTSFTLVVQ